MSITDQVGRRAGVARGRRGRRWLALAFALALVAAACGDDDGAAPDDDEPTGEQTTTTTDDGDGDGGDDGGDDGGEPRSGGTITMAMFIETAGLDPLVSSGSGTTGATEMAAIYDNVMRWNPDTGEYEPHTAESLEPNDDFTEWTLTLKPGIEFTDGTPYDAEAVKFSLDRTRAGQPGAPPCEELRACPGNTRASRGYMTHVQDITVIDDLTVQVSLSQPWPGFPLVLADEPGMVPSPTALTEMCSDDPDEQPRNCDFNLQPVGAGPFMIDEFRPDDEITMVANPDYWGGDVALDGLRFISFGDAGGRQTFDTLEAGEIDMAFLRDPVAVADAKEAGFDGYASLVYAGQVTFMNVGVTVDCADGEPESVCADQPDGPYLVPAPTHDPRVRQAVAHAIDPVEVDERMTGGRGFPTSQFFTETFPWYPDVPGPEHDPERARELVEEAKADGWDGSIRYLCYNAPSAIDRAQAITAMLESVGMEVELQNSTGLFASFGQFVQGDFDLFCSGMNVSDHHDRNAARGLTNNLSSQNSRVGYASDEMDAALSGLMTAVTDEEITEHYGTVSELYVQDLPFFHEALAEEFIAWHDHVNGVIPGSATAVYFDQAWVE